MTDSDRKRQATHNTRPAAADGPGEGSDVESSELTRLLRGATAGDEACWRSLVELYARRVYALARSRLCPASGPRTRGHDVAEEVTQSVFVTIAAKLSSGQYSEQGKFEPWLFRVAMNRIRDEIRRARRHAAPTDPERLDGIARMDAANENNDSSIPEQLRALRSALQELSEPDREVIELRHHAGLSFKQISDLLAEPLGTLLARHHRALRKLKDIMSGPTDLTARATGEVP